MSLFDEGVFVLAGFGVVMLALALLWWISALISAVVARPGRARAMSAPAASAAAALPLEAPGRTAPDAGAEVPVAHRIAIAAAVAVATGGRGRVLAVHAPPHQCPAWAGALRGAHGPALPGAWGRGELTKDKP